MLKLKDSIPNPMYLLKAGILLVNITNHVSKRSSLGAQSAAENLLVGRFSKW